MSILRAVTATSLFDGHDAAINIMRRILQDTGVEVIHLGHNRSVQEIVDAAIEEDVQGVAVSSYQGGHIEFFKYMVDLLRERGAGPHQGLRRRRRGDRARGDPRAGGLRGPRSTRPRTGPAWGLQGMINHMVRPSTFPPSRTSISPSNALTPENKRLVANLISAAEAAKARETATSPGCAQSSKRSPPAAGCRSSESPAPAAPASPR
jgi:isobutyryl-CoA mutase